MAIMIAASPLPQPKSSTLPPAWSFSLTPSSEGIQCCTRKCLYQGMVMRSMPSQVSSGKDSSGQPPPQRKASMIFGAMLTKGTLNWMIPPAK